MSGSTDRMSRWDDFLVRYQVLVGLVFVGVMLAGAVFGSAWCMRGDVAYAATTDVRGSSRVVVAAFPAVQNSNVAICRVFADGSHSLDAQNLAGVTFPSQSSGGTPVTVVGGNVVALGSDRKLYARPTGYNAEQGWGLWVNPPLP